MFTARRWWAVIFMMVNGARWLQARARYGIFNCMKPWYHVNKDTGCSINFADEAVVDFDFLFACTVVLIDGFVNDDLFDQCV